MKSIEMLKRKVAGMDASQAAVKVHYFNFCQFLQFRILFLLLADQALKFKLKLTESGSTNAKSKKGASGTGTLYEVCDGSFARAISTITPELIARLGAKWHGAHNNAATANVMCSAVISEDMNGLAASYDDLAAADKKAEIDAVTRMLRSGQHAARQHRERTAALVRELFAQTPPGNAALRDVELNVFVVEDGKPIMDPKKHPVFEALHRVYAGDSLFSHALVLFETEAEYESILDKCCLPEQKEFMNLLGIFHCFHCAVTLNEMLPVGAANLFHFKHDQAQYSIKPENYCKKPLIFPKEDLTASCYLNGFFFYVFSKFSDWQNM
jgi:hypothetical protein